ARHLARRECTVSAMRRIMVAILTMAFMSIPTLSLAQTANLKPVPFSDVRVEDASFWGTRLRINREKTLPHNLKMCETTGRVQNFAIAAGQCAGGFQGKFFFNDSDVYKVLEGAAYVYATNPDPQLDAKMDAIIAQIGAAQRPDGYLYTFYTIRNE